MQQQIQAARGGELRPGWSDLPGDRLLPVLGSVASFDQLQLNGSALQHGVQRWQLLDRLDVAARHRDQQHHERRQVHHVPETGCGPTPTVHQATVACPARGTTSEQRRRRRPSARATPREPLPRSIDPPRRSATAAAGTDRPRSGRSAQPRPDGRRAAPAGALHRCSRACSDAEPAFPPAASGSGARQETPCPVTVSTAPDGRSS